MESRVRPRPSSPRVLSVGSLIFWGALATAWLELGRAAPAASALPPTSPTGRAAPRAPSGEGVEILATFDGPSYSYELAVDRCAATRGVEGCPMRVRLLAAGNVKDSVIFGEHACGAPARTAVDSLFGVASDTPAWSTTGRGCAVGVAARPVRVGPNEVALLVTQRQGLEHVGRKHWLFTARGGKVMSAWTSDDEGAGTALDVRIVASPRDATEDVAVIDVLPLEGDADGVAERITVRRQHWDAASGRIVASLMPEPDYPLYLAYVGPFKSVAAARDAGDHRHSACTIPFGIVPATLFPGLGLRGYLRGAVLTSREEADARKAAAGPCPAGLTPKIIEYVPKLEYSAREPTQLR